MKRGPLSQRILLAQLVLLGAALVFLAVLQFRWIETIAAAEGERAQADLRAAVERARVRLLEEIRRTFEAFVLRDVPIPRLYDDWRANAPERALVRRACVGVRDEDDWRTHCYESEDGVFIDRGVTPAAEALRLELLEIDAQPERLKFPPPIQAKKTAISIVERSGPGHGPQARPRQRVSRVIIVDLDHAALARLLRSSSPFAAALVLDGRVAVATPGWSRGAQHHDDAVAQISSSDVSRPPMGLRRARVTAEWLLIMRPADRALDAMVKETRWRNALLGSGILLIVAESIAVMLLFLRRSKRVSEQQAAFVTMVTHELNTPLAVIRASAENLRDGVVSGPADTESYAAAIMEEADRVQSMVDDVLTYAGMRARGGKRALVPIDVAPVVDAAVARCRTYVRDTPIKLEVTIDPDLPIVDADVQSLRRAIENLIVNAIRYAAAGGWIGVRARREPNGVAITVADRGPGIDPADGEQIFEAFRRGQGTSLLNGAGLGLAIARQIAEEHGGTLTLDPSERGAALTIHLPAVHHG